jgi:3-oxoacyl-[acyl-carrier-protein] synthase-3
MRRVRIAGLSTYVPSRVLTNADLEKLVETSDEWILQRTGIRERHIVDDGMATSDMAKEAALGAIRPGRHHPRRPRLHRGRHDDAGHDLSQHRVPPAGQDRRDPLLGLRSRRRLFRFHLRADRRHADGRLGRARTRAGGRGRHHVEHHRLSGSNHLHPVRRRRRRRGGLGAAEGEPAIIDFAHEIDGSGGPALCMPAGGSRMPASHDTVDNRMHYVKQDGQTVFRFAVRKPRRFRGVCLDRNGLEPKTSTCSCPTRPTVASSMPRPSGSGCPSRRWSSIWRSTATRRARRFPWPWPDAVGDGRLKRGDLVLLASVGAGFTVGAVLMRWGF